MHGIRINPSDALEDDSIREQDRAALWAMAHRIADAPDSANATLARHCADLLVAVADVVNRKDGDTIELGDWPGMFDHICHRHTEAALYLLAHAFEPATDGMSPPIEWATRLVDSLLDQAS